LGLGGEQGDELPLGGGFPRNRPNAMKGE